MPAKNAPKPEPFAPLPNYSATSKSEKPGGGQANWVWLLAGMAVLVVIIFVGLTWKNANIPILSTATPALGIGDTMLSDKDGMTLVYVPEGEFLMGSTDADSDAKVDEKPQHTVYLDAFWIDQTEVTDGLYAKCVAAGKCDPQGGTHVSDSHPAKGVKWQDATAYCEWVGRRLPTEAEWEKAARGADGRIYPWGNQEPSSELANFYAHEGYTTEVGKYPAGASPYGALDMAGNAWEWTADWYDETYYKNSPNRNPTGPTSGTGHVLRGGMHSNSPSSVRSALRNWDLTDSWIDSYGIRCAR